MTTRGAARSRNAAADRLREYLRFGSIVLSDGKSDTSEALRDLDAALADERLAATPTLESLTAAIHDAMCDVSHHDSQTVCKYQRKYELIGEAVYRRLDFIASGAETEDTDNA